MCRSTCLRQKLIVVERGRIKSEKQLHLPGYELQVAQASHWA